MKIRKTARRRLAKKPHYKPFAIAEGNRIRPADLQNPRDVRAIHEYYEHRRRMVAAT